MTCPECDSLIPDKIGLSACPQCKSPLIMTACESNPRVRLKPVMNFTDKPRQLPGTVSYQIDIVEGQPLYRCVRCGKRFPVSHAPRRTQANKGRSSTSQINGSAVVDWIKRETLYSVAVDGVQEISSTAIPVMVTGPVCALCV